MSATASTAVAPDLLGRVAASAQAHLAEGVQVLDERRARELLAGIVPFGPSRTADDPATAAEAAAELGYPVVLKALGSKAVHKSDHGLVVTDLRDAAQVRDAAETVLARAESLAPGADWALGVQAQLSGLEVAIGVRRNELGAFCMVAAGGVLIEVLSDSALSMAPLTRTDAARAVDRLRVSPLLDGYRGGPTLDREALAELLVRVGDLAAALPEIAELDLNPVFVGTDGALAADARVGLVPAGKPAAGVEHDRDAVRAVFEPERIAVVGASNDTRKPGGLLLRYLRKHRFPGELVAVNPKDLELEDVRTYPSLSAVEGRVDLACIAVPAARVPSVIDECVSTGVPAGIIYSAGFAESGEEGARAQHALTEAAGNGFRFVGPNSIGAASPVKGVFATFGMALEGTLPAPGPVGLISQSGAIASSLISRSHEYGVGFSHWISAGNEADLGVADYLDYLVADPDTEVICMFLEVVRRPAAFAAACRRAREAGKPVVVLKTGRSNAGRAAAASHTGAMTGADQTYDAFFESCGAIRVTDLSALFAAAQGLTVAGATAGPRVGIMSMSGGACSLLADACSDAGLEVPWLPEETQASLRETLPEFGGVRNPVDVTAQGIGSPELVVATLDLLRASGAVDIVLVQLSTNADPGAEAMARDLIAAADRPGVPFLVGRLGAPALAPRAMQAYADAGMHVFTWPEQLVQAARASVRHGAGSQSLEKAEEV